MAHRIADHFATLTDDSPVPRRGGRRRDRGQMLVLLALSMVVLVGVAGLAIDASQDRSTGVATQAAGDAASTSAAVFLASEHLSAAPPAGDGVGPRAAAIAAINGMPVAAGYACTGVLSTYDVVYYDIPTSGGPCAAPSGWRNRLEVRIPPTAPVPAQCLPAYACVQVLATRSLSNSFMAVLGQSTTSVAMQSTALGVSGCASSGSIASVRRGPGNTNVGTTVAVTLGAASTAGTLLTITLENKLGTPTTGPAGWTKVAAATATSNNITSEIWYYPSNPGGITTATMTSSGAGLAMWGQMSEWSGAAAVPLDSAAGATATAATTLTVSASAASTGELAITSFSSRLAAAGALTYTPGGGWTNAGGGGGVTDAHATADYRLGLGLGIASETQTASASVGTFTGSMALFAPTGGCVASGVTKTQLGPGNQDVSGTVTTTIPAASTPGTLLTVTLKINGGPASTGPGAGWVRGATATNPPIISEVWYYPNNPGGISGATFTSAGAAGVWGQMDEWGGTGASPVDAAGSAVATNVSVLTVTAGATGPGELAVTAFGSMLSGGGSLTYTPGAGWINSGGDGGTGWGHSTTDYRLGVGPGFVSETETANKSLLSFTGAMMVFRAGAATGGAATTVALIA